MALALVGLEIVGGRIRIGAGATGEELVARRPAWMPAAPVMMLNDGSDGYP